MHEKISIESVSVGDEIPPLERGPIPKVQMVKYAGASGDFHPLHTDDELGQSVGLGGRIVHGMLVMGYAGEAITNWMPVRYLKKFGVRFTSITRPGETIVVNGNVIKKDIDSGMVTCEIVAKNKDGDVKLKGRCMFQLPHTRN